MNLIEKIIEEKINKYGFWPLVASIILSIVTSIILSILLLSQWFEDLVVRYIKLPFELPPILSGEVSTISSFNVPILAIGWLLLVIFFLWLWEQIKERLLYPRKSNRINSIPRISEWIFQGSLKVIRGDILETTASNSGCLIKDYFYRNFIMSFNLKILNGGRAGIIFRAQNLENYLMLEVVLADTDAGTIVYDIVPYIRFLGNWETFNITKEPYFRESIDLQKDLRGKLKYNTQDGLLVNLEVKDCIANLKIKSNDETKEFRWNIPTSTESNLPLPLGGVPIVIPPRNQKDLPLITDSLFVPKIWFRNKYGRIGFRAHAWQIVRISDFKIENII